MKKNKGFTLIELLAVILILGIIALIAIPTVNSILKESRTGAWKSTASQMTKAAENYFQLKQIKNQDYVVDFKTAEASNGKYFTDKGQTSATNATALDLDTAGNKEKVYNIMLESLSLKGDIPKFDEIDVFQIDTNGAVALAFSNTNAYCMTVDGIADFSPEDYEAVKNIVPYGGFDESGFFVELLLRSNTTNLKINKNGVVTLAYSKTNAYSMTVDSSEDFSPEDYEAVKNIETIEELDESGFFADNQDESNRTKLKIGGNVVCVSK